MKLRHFWLGAAVALFLTVNTITAAREYTFSGALAVFSLLTLGSLAGTLITGRIFTTALLLSGALGTLDFADRIKFSELRQHLHHQDAGIVIQFVRELNLGFFLQYSSIALPSTIAALAFVSVIVLSWRFEMPMASTQTRALLGIPLSLVATVSWILFISSPYLIAVRSQLPPRVSADRAPLRISAALAGLTESVALANTLAADRAVQAAEMPRPERSSCDRCPDIIIVHLESVYDPQFETAFTQMPALGNLVGGQLEKWNSLIRVHTWGGNSVVTEFELLCSVNHELFGWGGLQPHINVSPFISGCLGNELKSLGYKNNVLYSLNGSFSGVRTAFEKYGFDNFQDFTSLNLPTKWSELHDRLIYEKLFTSMIEPRDGPRSYFVSTNWNHGPHGLKSIEKHYPGPYSPEQADSPALADYVNRLNDSISGLNEIAEFIATAPYPVVVLAYGDHHPAFVKNYTPDVTTEFEDADYMTPLIMFRNFDGEKVEPVRAITVEETSYYLSRFAGIAPLGRLEEIRTIQSRCGGDQRQCPKDDQRRLRSVHLGQ